MTIRLKFSEVTRKQLSMLTAVAVAKATYSGVDIPLYLMLEYLDSTLRKSGTDVLEIIDERERHTVLLCELVLRAVRGTWLSFGEKEILPEDVVEVIHNSGWLPNKRTLQSWKQHWNLEKYLELRIVPVDLFRDRTPNSAERYSGYTKGYGQDGSPTAPHRTKEEPEDGLVGPPKSLKFNLQDLETYQSILLQIEKVKAAKR